MEAHIGTMHVNARVQKHPNALRMAGLRPVQIWVPDTHAVPTLRRNAATNVFSLLRPTAQTLLCTSSWMKPWQTWMAGQNEAWRSRHHRHAKVTSENHGPPWLFQARPVQRARERNHLCLLPVRLFPRHCCASLFSRAPKTACRSSHR